MSDSERFGRQERLAEVGPVGQARIVRFSAVVRGVEGADVEGPRIASCVTFFSRFPRKSGRYMISLTGPGIGCRDPKRIDANKSFVPRRWPSSKIARRMGYSPFVVVSSAAIATS
jgi:hypothetical protein